MSLFAQWTADRVRGGDEGAVTLRAFDAIERLVADDSNAWGDILGAEFVEQAVDEPRTVELMGPMTRRRVRG
jgi:hypothetical protein